MNSTDLDSSAIRAAHRIEHGYPPVYLTRTLYGFKVYDGRLVCVPIGPRPYCQVSFRGMSV